MKRIMLFSLLACFATLPALADVEFTDGSGLEYFIYTDTTETSSSASGAASDATYTTSMSGVTTSLGGTTTVQLIDAFDGYGAVGIDDGGEGGFEMFSSGNVGVLTDFSAASGTNRTVRLGPQTFGDLLVHREVFVPDDDAFCRWLTIITNTGSSTVNVVVSVPENNLGSDSRTLIHATAGGGTLASPNDNWLVSHDNYDPDDSNAPDPRLGHVFQNSGAPVTLSSIFFEDGDDNPEWEYDSFAIPAGETRIVMHFVTGQLTLAAAVAKAQALELLQGSALDFMSATEISQLVNFVIPVAPIAGLVLYGAATGCEDCFEESALFTIDPATGNTTLVGPIGFDNVTGLANVNGRLLATARGDDLFVFKTAILIEIDRTTGAGTLIGVVDDNDTGDCGRMPGLTFDSVNQILYAYSNACNPDEGLYTIDPISGAGTYIGGSGFSGGGNGLAIEPATGVLFATPEDDESLVVINPITGAGISVGGSDGNVPTTVNALAFNPVTGVLFGSQKRSSTLYNIVVIDTADGTTTIIGETVIGLDGLVFFFNAAASGSSGLNNDSPCVVATAAYGTPMESQINVLREVRDTYLLNTAAGTAFVEAYYTFSPPLADFVAKHPAAASTVRVLLTPIIAVASALWTLPLMAGAIVMAAMGYALRRRKLSLVKAES